jgi:small subunit ribosomal protein S4
MVRRAGQPKHRISRRFGFDVFGTGGPSLRRRLGTPPGGIRRGRRRRETQYGQQLLEKQKLKAVYGIDERALRRQFEAASTGEGPTGANLLVLLERRLDNVVYRLGFGKSRPMARQLVSHGHVRVDGRRLTIPSAVVDVGQRIELDPEAAKLPAVVESIEERRPVPEWLTSEPATATAGPAGRVTRLPAREDVDLPIEERLIVEFYRR